MESINSSSGPKRGYNEFLAQDLANKLRSKKDFYTYLDKHVSVFNFITKLYVVVILFTA